MIPARRLPMLCNFAYLSMNPYIGRREWGMEKTSDFIFGALWLHKCIIQSNECLGFIVCVWLQLAFQAWWLGHHIRFISHCFAASFCSQPRLRPLLSLFLFFFSCISQMFAIELYDYSRKLIDFLPFCSSEYLWTWCGWLGSVCVRSWNAALADKSKSGHGLFVSLVHAEFRWFPRSPFYSDGSEDR